MDKDMIIEFFIGYYGLDNKEELYSLMLSNPYECKRIGVIIIIAGFIIKEFIRRSD